MTRGTKTSEIRVGGLKLWARFTLAMTVALSIVMGLTGLWLYRSAATVAENVQLRTLQGAVELLDQEPVWEQEGDQVEVFKDGTIQRARIRYGRDEAHLDQVGYVYRYRRNEDSPRTDLVVPADIELATRGLFGLIVAMVIIVVAVGAGVAVAVANQIATPLEDIVFDIGQIAMGDLQHRTRVRSGGEIALLARSVDRMAKSLQEGQESKLELSVREREVEVAADAREALLPQSTPDLEGYDLGAKHVASEQLGGDFHDFIELPDGRVGFLVCDVSGTGLPAALVGAVAGAYLRRELSTVADVGEALRSVNQELERHMRRGTYVSALYALVDPRAGEATVACAGHKLPLIRYTAADGKVRLVQPEGISLGFDKGPIFESRLEISQIPIEPGDRLVLANTGPVVVSNPSGKELGEKAFYGQVLKFAAHPSTQFLDELAGVVERFAHGNALPRDVAIVTVART